MEPVHSWWFHSSLTKDTAKHFWPIILACPLFRAIDILRTKPILLNIVLFDLRFVFSYHPLQKWVLLALFSRIWQALILPRHFCIKLCGRQTSRFLYPAFCRRVGMVSWLSVITCSIIWDAKCRSHAVYSIVRSIFVVTGLSPAGSSMVTISLAQNHRDHSSASGSNSVLSVKPQLVSRNVFLSHLMLAKKQRKKCEFQPR